ncbi:MAG: translation elongation factor Ts [bacterium]
MEISAATVMKLRNDTGLSMMECKKALVEVGGDFEKAKDHLRKALKGKMDSRTDRAAGAGRVAVAIGAGKAAIIEVRAETDFTAMNEKFGDVCNRVAAEALKLPAGAITATPTMTAIIDEIRISSNENCSFARGVVFEGGVFGAFVHFDNKSAALIKAEGTVSADLLKEIGMHIVANPDRPLGVTTAEIPAELIEKERKFRVEQAIESGKPAQIAEKMVEGAIKKFVEERALNEQPFIKDPSKKIKDVVGAGGKLTGFVRYQVGE